MPVLWGLKMPVGKKAMLSGMFGMGTAYVLTFFPPRRPLGSIADIERFGAVLTGMTFQDLRANSLPHL